MARVKYTYESREDGKRYTLEELEAKHEKSFETYSEFIAFVEREYIEHSETVLSPYERTRNAVYATGNRWAIENFNATH